VGGRPAGTPACYEICVEGILDRRWPAWFDGLTVTNDLQLWKILKRREVQAGLARKPPGSPGGGYAHV
jgi:hypothetical protein